MRKLQSQGVHHITLVGADRQTSIDFWEGVLGMPFVFEQPNLDNATESHLYFDPGDGRLITVFTNEERTPDPTRTPDRPRAACTTSRSRSRRRRFDQAVERLDERGIRHSGVKDRGFMDSIYFEDPLGLLIELASYRFEPPVGYTHADVLLEAHKIRVQRGDYNIAQIHLADAIETLVRRSRGSLSDDRSAKDPYRSTRHHLSRGEDQMAANTLSILKPSVNNLTARIFVRAAGLEFEEVDVWGEGHRRVPREGPGRPDAAARGGRPAERIAVGELRDHAVPLQQARPRPALPARPRAAGDGRQRDVLPDRHALSARCARHLSDARLPAVRGRGRLLRGRRRAQGKGAEGRHGRARASRSRPTGRSSSTASRSSAATRRRSPTSVWPRRSSSSPRSTTTFRPGPGSTWLRWRAALGDAYSEPAADVRGYIASVKAPAA